MRYFIVFAFIAGFSPFVFNSIGCSPVGSPGGRCNDDGTCNGGFVCRENINHNYECQNPLPDVSKRRCIWESDCFCITCSEKCGASGVKLCAYSDTSV